MSSILLARHPGAARQGSTLTHRSGMTVERIRHCEERSDEAIQTVTAVRFWIASLALAMTVERALRIPATGSSSQNEGTYSHQSSTFGTLFDSSCFRAA
jgi:hypothetical protein